MAGDDPERDLFRAAMQEEGVEPIESDRRLPEPVDRKVATISERERSALRELDELVAGTGPFDASDLDERIEGVVPGLNPLVVMDLRRGDFTVQADLDLHGTRVDDARTLVERFLATSHQRGLRCVRIVHGRGKHSADGIPVLKAALPGWLSRGPARRALLAYTTAPPRDGGAGAIYVLLRRPQGPKRPR
jgi:DNA-nicking Smr family endonuclease